MVLEIRDLDILHMTYLIKKMIEVITIKRNPIYRKSKSN